MKIPRGSKVVKDDDGKAQSIVTEVKVLPKHIKNGVKGNNKTCAVALALADRFAEQDVSVGITSIRVDGYRARVLKGGVFRFVNRFDSGKLVKPFTFLIKLFK